MTSPSTPPLLRLKTLLTLAIARTTSQQRAVVGPPPRRCCCSAVGSPQPRPLLLSVPAPLSSNFWISQKLELGSFCFVQVSMHSWQGHKVIEFFSYIWYFTHVLRDLN